MLTLGILKVMRTIQSEERIRRLQRRVERSFGVRFRKSGKLRSSYKIPLAIAQL